MAFFGGVMGSVTFLLSFLEGVLSFFSPCVLPLLPVYLSFLSGGNVGRDLDGNLIFERKTILKNSFFFVLGISLTFLILSLGTKGLGSLFAARNSEIKLCGGIVIILFSLYQLFFYGTKYGAKKEARIKLQGGNKGTPLFSLLLGFTFSFSWTPCIGPVLASVLILSGTSPKGYLYLLSYATGFILPFLVLAFFASTVLKAIRKHMGILSYTVRIASLAMLVMGIMMVSSFFGRAGVEEIRSYDTEEGIEIEEVEMEEELPLGNEREEETEAIEMEKADIIPADIDYLTYSFLDQYSKVQRLSSYKGKVVVLNLWATWCGPCRSEMPGLENLYQKYREGDDVVIISAAFPNQSGEGDAAHIKNFMKDNGYSYPVLLDAKGLLSSFFSLRSYPTTIIFDRKGNICRSFSGALSEEYFQHYIDEALKL